MRAKWRRVVAPFDRDLPPELADEFVLSQCRRLVAILPELALAISLTTVAATLALMGDLPWWQQFGPPAVILAGCAYLLVVWLRQRNLADVAVARREIAKTPVRTFVLSGVAGIWCVSAFAETEQYYCVVAPVFITLAALIAANFLSGAPHGALAGVIAAFAPIVVKLLTSGNLGMQAIAIMMVVIALMQLRMIYAKFEETLRATQLEHSLRRLAETDPLTGLDNRRAFDRCVEAMLAEHGATVAIIDLDGFKAANDCHGHAVGDAVLVEVGRRLRRLYPDAPSVARLGGDEFAVVLPLSGDPLETARTIRAVVGLPFVIERAIVAITAGVGMASGAAGETGAAALVRTADSALYAEKRGASSLVLATA